MSDSVGSVSVEVVPDARGWSEKLRAQIGNTTAKVKADADTEEANAELDKVARTRTAKVKADVSQLSKGTDTLGRFADKLGLLPALAVAGTAALIPFAAAVGGIAAALAAPLVIAGGGAGLFAILGGFAVKDTEKQLKNIDTLHKKLTGLTKGTATYNATLKQLNAAQSSLTPGQVKFADATDKLKLSFQGLLAGKNGQALLGPITQGIDALAKILPAAEPLIRSVSGAFSTLITNVSKAASGPGFDRFIQMFSRQAGGDIVGFGRIIGNITTGLGGLFGVLDKQAGHSLVDELGHLTGEFSDWANSREGRRDVRSFLDYFHQVGPQVASTIGSVAHAIGQMVQALAPLGPPVLRTVQGIADAISGIPTGTLTGLAGALLAVTAYNKVGGFKATSKALTTLTGGGVGGGIAGLGIQKVYVVNLPPGGVGAGGVPGVAGKTALSAEGAGETAAGGSVLARLFGRYAGKGALSRVLGDALAAPALVSLGDYKTERPPQGPALQLHPKDLRYAYGPGGKFAGQMPDASTLKAFNATAAQAQRVLGLLHLNAVTGQADALNATLGRSSRAFDVVGHSAAANSATATRSISGVQHALDGLHDKKFSIIADTASAIHSLEALQAYRLRAKYLNVYQVSQGLDRAVGPGGGIGNTPSGLRQGDVNTHRNGSGGGAGRTPVHVHLDNSGRHTLTGFMEGVANDSYHANRTYEDQAAGR